MTAISTSSSSLLDRIGATRSAYAAHLDTWTDRAVRQRSVADPSTRVTFSNGNDSGPVYGDPRAAAGVVRLWSSPVGTDDTVSALMARNQSLKSSNLGEQWRGLGGALLTRFGETGKDDAQTLVDEPTAGVDDALPAVTPETQAQRAAGVLATQRAELAGVTTHASTAGLTIHTRSGQTVELKIAVNAGAAGMKVELRASGAMSAEDRAAIGQLANGLDRALEGLGRDDVLGLDLSGLMNYDRHALASVDLTASNAAPNGALGTFSLHIGDDKESIALQGRDGALHLSVDTPASPGTASAEQRSAAMQSALDRMDSAGERGHATVALVEQMKSAFEQMQAAAASDETGQGTKNDKPNAAAVSATDAGAATQVTRALFTESQPTTAAHATVDADVASALSGLADFDASFGGETHRTNRFGLVNEAGRADYRLSQTTTKKDAADGSQSVAQTVSEQLSAEFLKTPGDAVLDTDSGNYAETRINDSSTVTTLIDAAPHRKVHVSRRTDEQQSKTVTDFESRREVRRQSWPSSRSLTELLR